jgi:hypothetical protein
MQMDDLDDLFAQARAGAMQPSDDLARRVIADADRLQPRPMAFAPRVVAAERDGFWARLSGIFGGGLSLAGIGSAAVMGLFLGFAQPSALMSMTTGLTGNDALDTLELMPGVDALLAEE